MSIISEVVKNSVGTIISGATELIGKIVKDPNQAAQLSAEMQKLVMDKEKEITIKTEESYQQELKTKQAVMVAELQQEDKLTKRTRPAILLVGLAIIVLDFLFRWICAFASVDVPVVTIPDFFQEIWAGMCSVYIIARSFEKTGKTSKISKMITGG